MSEELVRELVGAAREEPQEDPRCEALARGELGPADVADLEKNPPIAQAFRPLGEAARARIADAVLAQLADEKREASRPVVAARVGAATASRPIGERAGSDAEKRAAPTAATPAKVMTLPRRRFAAFAAVASIAVAAGALLLLRPVAPLAGLPEYAISSQGGERIQRGDSPAAAFPRVGPGSQIEIDLRPATQVDGPVAVRAFLVPEGGAPRAWDPTFEVADGGAMRAKGTRDSLFGGVPAGRYEALFFVGRPGALPALGEVENLSKTESSGTSAVKLLRYQVLIADAPGGGH